MTEQQPDPTEDPREQDVAAGGYPEANPAPTAPGDGTEEGPEGERGRGGGAIDSEAPSPSTRKESDRERSTGNPHTAG